MASPGKWLKGLTPDTPLDAAASTILRERFRSVLASHASIAAAERGDRRARADLRPEDVHALRVATRRTAAAIGALSPVLPPKRARRLLRMLRDLRRAAGAVRDADVQLDLIASLPVPDRTSARAARDHFVRTLSAARSDSIEKLREDLITLDARTLKAAQREVLDRVRAREGAPATLGLAAARAVQKAAAKVTAVAGGPLETVDGLHELRLAMKALRYAVEVFGSCAGRSFQQTIYPRLVAAQDTLGAVNDAFILADALAATAAAPGAPSAARSPLRTASKAARSAAMSLHKARVAEWRGGPSADLHTAVLGAFAPLGGPGSSEEPPGPPARVEHDVLAADNFLAPAIVELKPAVEVTRAHATNGHIARVGSVPPRLPRPPRPPRIAAIDVGTNSIRLIVAEASDDGRYRILDDEREVSRLGRGLHETGRINRDAIIHSARTIARMKGIAEGYGAGALRIVGTCAAREASNAQELCDAIRSEAGVDLETISGAQEALLAYKSAAAAFDLRRIPAAVADIGGGSTEVVSSIGADAPELTRTETASGAGVVERVVTTDLGAVRLTEMFGGPEACAGPKFDAMRRHIRRELKRCVGKPTTLPQVFIGTGGTFTTLGAMAAMHAAGRSGGGPFSGPVQGFEVRRAEVMHLLDRLRKLSVKERARVPGLGADRADIIIAGLAVVDALMERFKVNRATVHEGGIRDGLLLTMVERLPVGARAHSIASNSGDRRDPLRSVRKFALACGYEQAHSGHVASLSLSIFDQLVALRRGADSGPEFSARDRVLLEAAAILHDIGYLINYKRHHRHSYHLIVHADLPGFSGPEVQVIANVARYHRGALPAASHENFAVLAPADRERVRALASVLRIADGLDRAHLQRVESLTLRHDRDRLDILAHSRDEPSVDLWGADRKANLYRATFARKVRFSWVLIPPDAGEQAERRRAGLADRVVSSGV